MAECKIRDIKASDAPSIARIMRELGWFPHFDSETFEETVRKMQSHIELCHSDSSHSLYAAEAPDGTLIGYAAAHWLPYLFLPAPETYVSELFVDESWRGKCVGKSLLKAVERDARARGCSRLMLCNRKSKDSYIRSFYAKQGWTERTDIANFIYDL